MDNYISVKKIKAEPCKAWKTMGEHQIGVDGYKIYYPDGYVSWCPKDVFEQQYLKIAKENSISKSDVVNFIADAETFKIGDKTTVVQATLKNGFILTESSSCVDKANFDMEVGKVCCMEQIEHNIWFLLGFLLQSADSGFNGGK